MKTLLAGILLAVAVAGQAEARAPVCVNGSEALAEAQFTKFNAAWATRDPDVVTKLFADDAVVLPTLSPVPRSDHAGIRDYFVGFLKGSPQARIPFSRTWGGCNWMLRAGQWIVTLKDEAGNSREVNARVSFLYRRIGGRWMIEHLHSSVDPAGH